jgi:hypothetical protein
VETYTSVNSGDIITNSIAASGKQLYAVEATSGQPISVTVRSAGTFKLKIQVES